MRLFLDCYPCILRQALTLARLMGLGQAQTKATVDNTLRLLLNADPGSSPPQVMTAVYQQVEEDFFTSRDREDGTFDPYAKMKRDSNRIVLEHLDELEASVRTADSPLEMGIRLAAAGNIIDFAAADHGSVDIPAEIRGIPVLSFAIYDIEPLLYGLETAKTLVYVGDNAGEIVFDRVFIRQLQRDYPELDVVFATRERPIINDVTVDDAHDVGMDVEATVVSSGCPYPGLVLSAASEGFRRTYDGADVVIAKGQGNYEGLCETADERLFHIFRVKCERVAELTSAPVGALVLEQSRRSA